MQIMGDKGSIESGLPHITKKLCALAEMFTHAIKKLVVTAHLIRNNDFFLGLHLDNQERAFCYDASGRINVGSALEGKWKPSNWF